MNQREELDQLLSAYFDGELVREEHAQADAALKSAENQRVVEEYEMLHESIQTLPARRLRSSFSHDLVGEIDRQKRTQLSGASRWQRVILFVASAAAVALLMWAVFGRTDDNSTADGKDGKKDKSPAVVAKDDKQPDKTQGKKDRVGPTKDSTQAVVKDGAKKKTSITKGNPQLVQKDDVNKKQPGPADKKSPNVAMPKYLLTFEVVLVDRGDGTQTLDRIFARNGISSQPELKVSNQLEQDLLKSRLLKDVVGRKVKQKNQVQLIYVLADPNSIDPLWDDLRKQPGKIVDLKFNIAIADELAPFEQLKRAERNNFAKLQKAKNELNKHAHRARRLALNLTLFSKLARANAAAGTLRSDSGAPLPSPFSPTRVLGNAGKDKKQKSGAPHDLKARKKTAEILIIVHRVVKKAK